jgi:hypothetical protein
MRATHAQGDTVLRAQRARSHAALKSRTVVV